MKDNFSAQASEYAQFRPGYPLGMIAFIVSLAGRHGAALDIGTGNGQVAHKLSPYFKHVYATDISESQLRQALQAENLTYFKEAAEKTGFDKHTFDLITVAQAVHWFDFDPFYMEVRRILKPGGIFAIMGYGLFNTNPEADSIISTFYHNIVGPYWDAERHYIDENYKTIPFPFDEIEAPGFENRYTWTFEQLTGYLSTWSATRHYIAKNGIDPVSLIHDALYEAWRAGDKQVRFPMLLRTGKLKSYL